MCYLFNIYFCFFFLICYHKLELFSLVFCLKKFVLLFQNCVYFRKVGKGHKGGVGNGIGLVAWIIRGSFRSSYVFIVRFVFLYSFCFFGLKYNIFF